MKIALNEAFPILERLLKKRLNAKPYFKELVIEPLQEGVQYDLILSDRHFLPRENLALAELVLFPDGELFPPTGEGQILRGGMGLLDEVTFSSIGESRALLCVGREIRFFGKWIGPFEKPVPFDRDFSLYKNLAAGFAAALTEIRFGEESLCR